MAPSYQLFDSGNCNAELPVNEVVDEFTFIRFARLQEFDPTRPSDAGRAVVLPRDVVNPRLTGNIRRELFYYPAAVVKGGVGLKSRWDEIINPREPDFLKPTAEVKVTDLGHLFGTREIVVGGTTYKAEITPSNVFDLRTEGVTVVSVGVGTDHRLVKLYSPSLAGDEGDGSIATPLESGDVDTLLSHGTLIVGGEEQTLTLGHQHVVELATFGITEATVGSGPGARRVVVSVTDSSSDGIGTTGAPWQVHTFGGVGTSRSAATMTTDASHKPTSHQPQGAALDEVSVDELISRDLMSKLEFVLYLPYRQTWTLTGYARGELINTISLAPEQETTIEVLSWDRHVRSTEDIVTTEQEGTFELQMTDKRSRDIVNELTKDSGWSFSIGGGVTIPAGDVPVNVTGNYSADESMRDFHNDTKGYVKEAVQRASARFKTTHQTKVTETHEWGSETRTTRTIKNPNMCHSLDLDYFEVVAGYDVETKLDVANIRLCVLTSQFLPGEIDDPDFILANEYALRETLLAPSLYAKCFDSLHTLLAWDAICDIKCKAHCPCDATTIVPHTQPTTTTSMGSDETAQAVARVATAAQALRASISAIRNGEVTSICKLANDIDAWSRYVGIKFWNPMSASEKAGYEQKWDAAKPSYRRYLYAKALEIAAPRFWQSAADYLNTNDDTPDALERFVASAGPSTTDILNVASIQLRLGGAVLATVTDLIKNFCVNVKPLQDNFAFDSAGLDGAFTQARAALETHRQATAPKGDDTGEDTEGGLANQAALAVKQSTSEWSNKEIAQARVEVEALKHHLRRNESYYRQAIWRRLDPGDRYVAMSTMGDLLRYVDTQALGFVGKKAALPFRLAADEDLTQWFKTNILDNTDLTVSDSAFNVTLPTGGITTNGRLGKCELCEEFITEHRQLDIAHKTAEVEVAKEKAAQAKFETARREARLKADNLDVFESSAPPTP